MEVDDTYVGGKLKNMPKSKREKAAVGGPTGKTAAVGAKDRETNHEATKVFASTDKKTLQGFVEDHAAKDATVYMVEAGACKRLKFDHETVRHSLKDHVWANAHKYGIKSLWTMLKHAHKGTFHKISPQHLDRYVQEFAGGHNVRNRDTIDQMGSARNGMDHKRLTYKVLTRNNRLPHRSSVMSAPEAPTVRYVC